MFSAKLMSRALVACGFVCVFAAFTLPEASVECHAIDFDDTTDPGVLKCEGSCDPATEQCIPRNHSGTGVVRCACADNEPLPQCCELASYAGSVSTVGDCPSCPATGRCVAEPVSGSWNHFQAMCTPPGGGGG